MSDTVLVVGGGLAGLQAALTVAEAGKRAVLVEKSIVLGGQMAGRLGQDPSPLQRLNTASSFALSDLEQRGNIEVLTSSELVQLDGAAGEFTAKIRRRARFVTDACTHCGKCRQVCPQVTPNEFQANMTFRKAIFTPYRDAWPRNFAIDIDTCLNNPPNYLPCGRCQDVCEDSAIRFDVPLETTLTREVQAVVVCAGFELRPQEWLGDADTREIPDVLTASELEALLRPDGPTGGYVENASNGETPSSVLFVLQDDSPFSWAFAGTQAARLSEQGIEEIAFLCSVPAPAEHDSRGFWNPFNPPAQRLLHGVVESIDNDLPPGLSVHYTPHGTRQSETELFDLVVLVPLARPPESLSVLCHALGIESALDGYVKGAGTATTRQGVYAAGCVRGPKGALESINEAKMAALDALAQPAAAPVPVATSLTEPIVEAAPPVPTNGKKTAAATPLPEPSWLSNDELRTRFQGMIEALIELGGRKLSAN